VIQTTNIQLQYIVEDEIHFLFQFPQYSSIRSKFGIDEQVLAPTDILDEEMIKTINPVSSKDLKYICMYRNNFRCFVFVISLTM
jgi:hypothetical protein